LRVLVPRKEIGNKDLEPYRERERERKKRTIGLLAMVKKRASLFTLVTSALTWP
jgi:hypothetical protein